PVAVRCTVSREQPLLLVVADEAWCHPGAPCDVPDLHLSSCWRVHNNIDIDINVKVYRRGMRTAQQSFHPSRPGAEERLPWPALLVLGSATLVMVTGEMLPTAVLAAMSAGLGVTEASTGMLVSLWALVVVVTSFPLVRLTRAWDRTNVISASMLLLSGSALLTAVAPGYTVALAGRTMGAAAV